VVSVGYAVAGLPGAIAGWAAICTPALLVVPLIHFASRQAAHRRMRGATHAVVAASVGLLIAAVAPLAREALTDTLTIGIAVVCAVLIFRKVNPLWLMAGASLAGLATAIVAHG